MLYDLIDSLNQAEKRHFKIDAVKQRANNNYIKLFSIIEKQTMRGKGYDEKIIRTHFKGEKFLNQLPVAKNYLYNAILKNLRFYYSDYQSNEVEGLIQEAVLLFDRGLASQFKKHLEKAKKMAKEYEMFPQYLTILSLKRSQVFLYPNPEKLINEINEEEIKYLKIIDLRRQLVNLNFLVFQKYMTEGIVKSDSQLNSLMSMMKDPILRTKEFADVYTITFQQCNILAAFGKVTANYELLYKTDKRKFQEAMKFPVLTSINIADYIFTLNDYLHSCCKAKRFSEAEENLFRLEKYSKAPKIPRDAQRFAFMFFNLVKLNLCIAKAEFKEGLMAIKNINIRMAELKPYMPESELLFFHLRIAVCLFGDQKYKECLEILNQAYDIKDGKREDFHSQIRILTLVVHYELKNYDYLEHIILSSKYYLTKRKYYYKAEEVSLSFFRKHLLEPLAQNEVSAIFRKFKDELSKAAQSPFEKNAFNYFNIFLWIDSKIKQTSFMEIAKKDYKNSSI